MTNAVSLAQQASTGVSPGFRNRIINGAMVINQRGVTSGVTSGYFVDRWTLSGCSTSSVLTSSLPTGFTNGISISATSGNPIAIQKIESKNCSDLSGQSVTLSFYAQNISNATTLYASLAYANSADNFGSTTTISEQNLGTLTGSWVRYSYTWNNLPSGALNGLSVNILCAGTSTFTMGITGVQLEVGSTATSFDTRSYTTELQLAQRYFWTSGAGAGSVAYSIHGSGAVFDTDSSDIVIRYPVNMRTAPTVTFSNVACASNSEKAVIAIGDVGSTQTTAFLRCDHSSGFTAGYGAVLYNQNNANGFVRFSSEL
jgi:hypothetical protein